jgi:hypothetical protein
VLEEFELLFYPFPNLKLGWYIPQTLVQPPPLAIIIEEHIFFGNVAAEKYML